MSEYREIQMRRLDELAATCEVMIRPRRDIGIAEWGAENRSLESMTAAKTGRYDPTVTPWMAEIFAVMHPDSGHDFVAVMKCQQSGLTELGLTWIAYTLVEDPGPWLVVQPTITDQKAFVGSRVASMRETTPALPPAADTDNLQMVTFPGSVIRFGNAGSKGTLSSQPVRYVLLDEAAKYPQDTQGGGDPIAMARGRTTTFKTTRKILMISTPEIAGTCAMERAYLAGDQRRYEVPCPECGTLQELVLEQLTDDALYECIECHHLIDENRHKTWMLERGQWVARNPEGEYPSFHVSGLMRPLSWDGWAEVLRAIRSARTPSERKSAITLQMGIPYQEIETHALPPESLLARRETYRAEVPAGVAMLTAGVDVQADRLEAYVYGWGAGEECWLVARRIIRGRPQSPGTWRELESILDHRYTHETAGTMPIMSACVDAGYQTQTVYEWAQRWHGKRRWYAVMGHPSATALVWPRKPSSKKIKGHAGRVLLYMVGAVAAKEVLLSRLTVTEAGPEFLHLPDWTPPAGYAEQLLSEQRVVKHHARGRIEIRYTLPDGRRNEALDCTVYAYGALKALEADGITPEQMLALQRDVRQGASKAPVVPVRAQAKWGAAVGQAWGNIGGRRW